MGDHLGSRFSQRQRHTCRLRIVEQDNIPRSDVSEDADGVGCHDSRVAGPRRYVLESFVGDKHLLHYGVLMERLKRP